MGYNLFLDDERYPSDHDVRDFHISRTSEDAITVMTEYGCPDFISFDHDLGGEDTAMNVINWMITQDMDRITFGMRFIPDHFAFAVHSQNPIGAKNIKELLNRYLRFRSENGNVCV